MAVWLGLDYGLRRIGVAASNQDGTLAFAVGTHVEGRDGSFLKFLSAIINERGAAGLVVGLPLTADGRETDMAARARAFAERLVSEFGLPVVLYDERFTSRQAKQWLGPAKRKRKRKEDVDALAAEIILQDYLDSRNKPAGGVDGNMEPDS